MKVAILDLVWKELRKLEFSKAKNYKSLVMEMLNMLSPYTVVSHTAFVCAHVHGRTFDYNALRNISQKYGKYLVKDVLSKYRNEICECLCKQMHYLWILTINESRKG